MTAHEFMRNRIAAVMGVNEDSRVIAEIRLPDQTDDIGGVPRPSVVYRQADEEHGEGLDGPSNTHTVIFEVECRAEKAHEARRMARDIVLMLGSRLVIKLNDYGEQDDPSQKRGLYFSHIITVGISES